MFMHRKHLPHTLDKAENGSAASGSVWFLTIYTCNIFAMLLLDFPHALLLATSKLISYMFPMNVLYSSCSWLFFFMFVLCCSCDSKAKQRLFEGSNKKLGAFLVKSEYIEIIRK